ncbi:LRR receptor-like serine/threonine-protein kinase ERL1 [Ziziphus jujuba]|uniref:LRR receptor-like serine/threonine-protein kinase ERL1 n=1 Tax=Ziziphus jujuba TaxID=326968 RepID=A0ABM4A181_ZIZJJ|nr:LRR receptor-like serine/threonine-protein kinase ERL1 [Ziziphus jujuba]
MGPDSYNIGSLVTLDISSNYMCGTIPLGFSELPNLQFLYLGDNFLSQSCHQLSRGRWEKIDVLDFGWNNLHGKLPASIGNLTFLSHLDLNCNSVDGGIPSSIGKLCNLISLYMSASFGSLQNRYGRPLPNPQYLYLSDNQLVGKLPKLLAQLENLLELDLFNNSLYGPIPTSFGILQQNLTIQLLGENEVNGTLPESLEQLSELHIFDVSSNQLTGAIVDFSSNNFSGSIPILSGNFDLLDISKDKFFGNISNKWNITDATFSFLSVAEDQLNGEIPAWNIVPTLKVIDLSNNNLIGSIPSSIGNCVHLSLPSSLQNLSSLETLNLGNNRLNGRIPPLIGKGFESLRILILRSNSFLGELLALLSNLSSLQVLDLAENQLTGSIPASFGHFKGQLQRYTKTLSLVTMLDLSGNNLSGDLPTEMTNLFGLVILNLSRNHFTCHIPKSISKLKQLSSLDLLDFRTKNTAKTKETGA